MFVNNFPLVAGGSRLSRQSGVPFDAALSTHDRSAVAIGTRPRENSYGTGFVLGLGSEERFEKKTPVLNNCHAETWRIPSTSTGYSPPTCNVHGGQVREINDAAASLRSPDRSVQMIRRGATVNQESWSRYLNTAVEVPEQCAEIVDEFYHHRTRNFNHFFSPQPTPRS